MFYYNAIAEIFKPKSLSHARFLAHFSPFICRLIILHTENVRKAGDISGNVLGYIYIYLNCALCAVESFRRSLRFSGILMCVALDKRENTENFTL